MLDSEGNVGQHISMVLDSHEIAYSSYYRANDGDGDLYTGQNLNPFGTFNHSLVASGGDVGLYSSIALNSTEHPRIAYYNKTSGDLIYNKEPGKLEIPGLTSFILDSDGDVGQYVSLAIDSLNNVHIAYYDATHGDLKYLTFPDADPTPFPVTVDSSGDVGMYASLGIDSLGHPHIVYYDATNGDLKHATKIGNSWTTEIVDSEGDVGRHASLARAGLATSPARIQIAYYDSTNGNLKYAVNGTWTHETVHSAGDVGQYASIAIDHSGHPNIAFYDSTNGNLMRAVKDGSSWTVETVHSTEDVGQYASMVVDPTGFLFIVYYDATNGDLRYATNAPPPSTLAPAVVFASSIVVLIVALRLRSGPRRKSSWN